MTIRRFSSGGPWENVVGYSRAVAVGPWIMTAGCTSTVDGQVAHAGDAYRQTLTAFGIALDAVRRAGGDVADVVRTRMYMVRSADEDAVGRAHLELFGDVRPACTMLTIAALAHPDHLVEVEVDAYLASAGSS